MTAGKIGGIAAAAALAAVGVALLASDRGAPPRSDPHAQRPEARGAGPHPASATRPDAAADRAGASGAGDPPPAPAPPAPRKLRVLVRGPGGGPIAGARVSVEPTRLGNDPTAGSPVVATTGAEGRAEFDPPGDIRLTLTVQADGYRPFAEVDGQAPGDMEIGLEPAPALRLLVTGRDGAEVAAAAWALFPDREALRAKFPPAVRGTWSRDGPRTVPLPPEGAWKSLGLVCSAEGLRSTRARITPADAARGEVVVVLAPPPRVTGTVVEKATGAPVASGRVILTGDRFAEGPVEAGRYSLPCTAAPDVAAILVVQAPGFVEERVAVDLSGEGEVEVPPVALVAGARISGRVVEAPDGSPLPGAVIEWWPCDDVTGSRTRRRVLADGEGGIDIGSLRPGALFCVEFSAEGRARRRAVVAAPAVAGDYVRLGDVALAPIFALEGRVEPATARTGMRWVLRLHVCPDADLIRRDDGSGAGQAPFLDPGGEWAEVLAAPDGSFRFPAAPAATTTRELVVVEPHDGTVRHSTFVPLRPDGGSIRVVIP